MNVPATVQAAPSGIGANARYFEEFEIGQSWISPARTIAEADLVMFSGLTGDYNPIHTDEEFAKKSHFGGRILHGPAAFAIATGLESRLGLKDGTAIAFLGMTWDLKAPVKIGDTIRVHQRVASKRKTTNPGRGIVNFWVQLVNQRDEICQEGEWKVMFSSRPSN